MLEVLREAKTLKQIAGRRDVHPNMLGRWKNEAVQKLPMLFDDRSGNEKRAYEAQIQELYAQIGELTAKLSWLKKNLGLSFNRAGRLKMLDNSDPDYTVKE